MSSIPSHEEHCQNTLKKFGVRGDDIHKYMDELCTVFGREHRQFRHKAETVKLIGEFLETNMEGNLQKI